MEQMIQKKILPVEGMSCTNCEMRIENKLGKLDGVLRVKAIYSSSNVYVTYDAHRISLDRIIEAIEELDYSVRYRPAKEVGEKISGTDEKAENPPSSRNGKTVRQLLGWGILALALYLVIDNTIGFNFIPEVDRSMGYGLLFVVGLLTSLHCVAMCGGINLSQSIAYRTNAGDIGKFSRLKPGFLYNAGRVISYTLIGGVVGAFGSVISFSGVAKGVVAILSGIFMMIMGLNMLNIFPWLRKLNPRMPKAVGKKIYGNNGRYGPFFVGLLNGLMPCGPLQSMQLYALGTGNFVAGAMSMFVFSLGTVPLMFGFGAVSSILSGKFTHRMFKVSAVLVILLGVVMAGRGLTLSGFNIASATSGKGNIAEIQGDVQVVATSLESGRYTPIVVQKGIPVRWTIQADQKDLNGCNNPIVIPQFDQQVELSPGDNLIEFTPESEGNIPYSCWMGMIRSNIRVVSDLSEVSDEDIEDISEASGIQPDIPTLFSCH